MARGDKTCVMCNTHYKFCESCPSKYNITETWRNIFCSENCRKLYHVYDQIKAGQITDKNAMKELKKLDTSCFQNMNEPMKSVLAILVKTEANNNDVENKSDDITKEIDKSQKKGSKPKMRHKRINEVD